MVGDCEGGFGLKGQPFRLLFDFGDGVVWFPLHMRGMGVEGLPS